MTIKFYNSNDSFGDAGPHDAESKEALADEMAELFEKLAIEDGNKYHDTPRDAGGAIKEEWIGTAINGPDGYRQNFIDGLVAQYHGEPRIIFDNADGITLQLPGYTHSYDAGSVKQCAEDIIEWVESGDTSDWEGNEEEAVFEPTSDEIRNGGYLIETVEDFMSLTYAKLTKKVLG